MMKKSYYVIKPTSDLRRLLQNYLDVALFLNDPFLWVSEEGGYTSWKPSDYQVRTKLIFLAYLKARLEKMLSPKFKQLSGELFNQPPIDVSLFDKWWTIERFVLNGDVQESLESLQSRSIREFSMTGNNIVDDWIEKILKIKA